MSIVTHPGTQQRPAPAWQRRFHVEYVTLPSVAAQRARHVVYASTSTGVWQLHAADLESGRSWPLTAHPEGVREGVITADGRHVVWFSDEGGSEVGGWVASPFDGGPAQPVFEGGGTGWASGVATAQGLIAAGVATGSGTNIWMRHGDDEARRLLTCPDHAEASALSTDGSLLALTSTAEHGPLHPTLTIVDVTSGGVTAHVSHGAGAAVTVVAFSPRPADHRLVFHSTRSGHVRPWLWSPEREPRPLQTRLSGDVEVAAWWPDAASVLVVQRRQGRTGLHRVRLSDGAAVQIPVPRGVVHDALVRPDGHVWVRCSSATTPPTVRALDEDGRSRVLFGSRASDPPAVAYRERRVVNGEGGSVHAFVATPPGNGPFPLVAWLHGGPHMHDEDRFDPWVQSWVDAGFAVALVNYRGSTGYGTEWKEAVVRDPGRPELVDVAAVQDALVLEGLVDARRCVVGGASWGGYLALLAAGTQPARWSAAIAFQPIADYLAAYDDESPLLQAVDRQLFGGSPEDLPDLYAQRSPITHVDRVTCPVFISAGANDTRCPRAQIERYVAALRAAGGTCVYHRYDAGHGSQALDGVIDQQARALAFAAQRAEPVRV